MSTFKDFLVWYNNLDVVPFVEAIQRQSAVYREKGIDMLKDAISLPGLAIRWMFNEAPQPSSLDVANGTLGDLSRGLKSSQPISLLDETNKQLYRLIKDNVVGGPAIVFTRYHHKGETLIRAPNTFKIGNIDNGSNKKKSDDDDEELWKNIKECVLSLDDIGIDGEELWNSAKECALILGIDASALYLYCFGQDMPTGYPRIRKAENDFAAEPVRKHSKVAQGWLEYVSWKEGVTMRHARKGGEVRLGGHNLPVDGFCSATNTVYQFHGCFWHGHPCYKTGGIEIHPKKGGKMKDIYADTLEKDKYLRHLGYEVRSMWECQWEEKVNCTPEIKAWLRVFFSAMYPSTKKVGDLETAVESIRDGSFFGFVECDISVPEELKEKFSEMGPVFKNVDVCREDLSEHMREFAESNDYLNRPQRMLIGSLFGEKILLLSGLARWYLEHGLVITKIYQMIDYVARKAFAPFCESVSNARRMGDVDPDLELLASTSKLVGNSAYGKTITNKEKHRQVKYVDGEAETSARIRKNNFVSLDEIDRDFYEIVSHKPSVSTFINVITSL
jgi:G:T-mismatch repair DNA endonuclease (very short patch repair protein)